jgi:nucleotide-binding universal stress UspA family protein
MDVELVPSVLLIIEPHAPSQPCLGRALMLARYLHARLDIVCPEGGLAGSPALARKLLQEERQYIAALLQSITAPDVDMTIETAPGPLASMIAAKAREKHSAIVIKAPWNHQSIDSMDAQLMRNCPVPLLLSDGRPWHPRSRLLAAVNVARTDAGRKNTVILEVASALQRACGAQLDLAFVHSRSSHGEGHAATASALTELERLKARFHVPNAHIHLLNGDAAPTLREFARHHAYDMLIVGAPTCPVAAPWPRPLSVAQTLIGIGCDLLSVQDPEGGLHERLGDRRRRRYRSFPLWQFMGADQ